MQYPVAIQQQNDKYHAYLPDISDLVIEGDSVADTISKARVKVFERLQHLADTEQPLPEGSDVSFHLSNTEFAGWTWAIISVESTRIIGETITLNIDLPERLLERISHYAEQQHIDINDFFIQSARNTLKNLED